MTDKRLQKIINVIFAVLVISVFAYFALGEIFLPNDHPGVSYVCSEYHGEWERVNDDGSSEHVDVPGSCAAERDELVVLETRLPDKIENNRYLCFRSAKQDMKFYVGGELRQLYSTDATRMFGRMSAAAYVFVEINSEDAGKVLRVESQTDSSYSGIFYTVYYGNMMGIWRMFFDRFGVELIVAFITLILSIIVIVASMILRVFYHRRVALEYLGWGILFAAVWLITNSNFRQLIFGSLSTVNDITFLMIMLLALPYLIYMNEIQKGRYAVVYRALECIVIVNFFVCAGLHMTGICDFTDTIKYVSAFCILSILLMIITIVVDVFRKKVREYTFVAVGMFGVCAAAFVQIIIYFQRSNQFNGVILAIGLIFLLVFSTISTIYEIIDMDREKQQALKASEAKGRFLANMSHEIRTPIHAVLGMDAMILRESNEPQIREYALDIQNAGQTLLSLINDILDISKIESGKLELVPVEYDFSSLIHDVVNMMKQKAEAKELAFELSVDKNIPSRLFGDDVRIRQILVNLMSNAIKYTEHGKVALKVEAKQHEDMLSLGFSVSDTGIGIKKEDMEKLFAEFQRLDEKKNRNVEGTGLGMSITTQLLEMMGSRLEVESVYGEGSEFSFTLEQKIIDYEPIGDLEQRIKSQASEYKYNVMFQAPDASILVVDDNAVNRKVFMNLLKATRMHIEEAAGGEQCLEYVKEKKYDIIFLDHMMPGMDGIQVLHEMQKLDDFPCKDTPVIALTANAVTGAREMYIGEGFSDFLSKPVRPERMERLIMELLPKDKVIEAEGGDVQEVTLESVPDKAVQEPELPAIDGFDWEYALLHCGDKALLVDTINNIYKMIDEEALQLEGYFDIINEADGDTDECGAAIDSFRIKVHSMKSSAAMMGAMYISGTARMLEYAARDGRTGEILSITPFFLEEWRNMKAKIKPLVTEEHGEGGKKTPDKFMIVQFLGMLKSAIQSMDVDTADEIIKQLVEYEYANENVQQAMAKLEEAVLNLDEEQTDMWADKLGAMVKELY